MSETENRIYKFNEEYNKLDPDTQAKLDNFMAGIEEVGQDRVGGTIFNGSAQLLESFMPSLQVISPTIAYLKIDLHDGNYCYELKWEPNDFIIPDDLLIRAYERINVSVGQSSDNPSLKIDSPNNWELLQSYDHCDDCPSSM
jgi:hypothetical protein